MDILKLIVSKYPYCAFTTQGERVTEQCLGLAWVSGFIEINIDMLVQKRLLFIS
jgi:hypothetical protein